MAQQPQSREDRVKADAREQSTVRLILDILGLGGAATAGAVRGLVRSDQDVWDNIMGNLSMRKRDSFDDVFGDMGMGPSWTRSGLGLAADIVVDPTNLIPFGAATKVVKGVGKGLGRLTGAALDVLPKGDVVKDAALTAKNALGKAFVPYYGLPEDYVRLRRERDVVARSIPSRTYDELLDSFRGTTTAERQAVATALDTGVLPGKVNLDDLTKQYRNTLTKTFLKESDAGLQQSSNFIGDYFPYVFRDKYGNAISQGGGVNARLPFAKKRTSESLADAAAKGADTDAATALFTRLAKGRTAVHDAEFVQNVLAKYGIDASQGVPSGFMKPRQGRIADRPFWSNEISLDGTSKLTRLGDVALPKDIADNISRLLDSGNTEDVVRGWDWLTRKWKGLATIYRPDIAFEMTNFQGNLWNSRLGGQNWALPKHIARFWQPTPTRNIGGLTPDEVVEAAKKYGISAVSGSSIGDAINADSLASGLARSLEPWGERTARMLVPTSDPSTWHRPVTGLPRLAGSGFKTFKDWLNPKIELASKQSFFEDALRKYEGLPKDEQIWRAYDDVSKYMFDYGELTDFERNVMRRIVPFYCVPAEAEALTRDGWCTYDQISTGDEVLSYNIEQDKLEWVPVDGVATFEFDGLLHKLETQRGIKLLSTFNHKWPVRKLHKTDTCELVESADLCTNDALVVTAELAEQSTQPSLLSVDDARLLGWLLTDGYWRQRGTHVEAVIYQSPKKFLHEVSAIAGGTPRKPHPDTGVVCVPVVSDKLVNLKPLLSRGKRANWLDVVTRLSTEARMAMLDAMYKADGTVAGDYPTRFFAAINPYVREVFEFLEFTCGRRLRSNSKGCYSSAHKTLKLTSCEQSSEHYTGIVWCPSTRNHTWVMRQNGFITITGNTWMRKNVPVAVKGITDRPSSYASLDKIVNASEGLTEDLGIQEPPEYRPEWMQRNPVMQVPNLLPGAPEGSTQFLNLYLPLQDLNKIPMPGGSDVLDVGKELLSGLHPALKLPYELLSGKSAFTGLSVYDEQLGPVDDLRRAPFPFNWIPTDVTDALPFVKAATVQTPDGPEVQTSAGFNTAFNTMLPLASTGGRVLDTMVGTGLPSQAFSPWTSLLGMRFMPRTPEQMQQSRRSAFTTYRSKSTKERKQRDQGGNTLEDYINRVLNGRR